MDSKRTHWSEASESRQSYYNISRLSVDSLCFDRVINTIHTIARALDIHVCPGRGVRSMFLYRHTGGKCNAEARDVIWCFVFSSVFAYRSRVSGTCYRELLRRGDITDPLLAVHCLRKHWRNDRS